MTPRERGAREAVSHPGLSHGTSELSPCKQPRAFQLKNPDLWLCSVVSGLAGDDLRTAEVGRWVCVCVLWRSPPYISAFPPPASAHTIPDARNSWVTPRSAGRARQRPGEAFPCAAVGVGVGVIPILPSPPPPCSAFGSQGFSGTFVVPPLCLELGGAAALGTAPLRRPFGDGQCGPAAPLFSRLIWCCHLWKQQEQL